MFQFIGSLVITAVSPIVPVPEKEHPLLQDLSGYCIVLMLRH